MAKNDESHEIRLPESILELIDEKKYENDERFAAFSNGKKRKEKRIPRKEQRQQERLLKKQKRSNGRDNKAVSNKTTSAPKRSKNKPVSKASNESIDDPLAQLAALKNKKKSADSSNSDPLAQLAALKNKKSSKKSDSGIRIVKEDDLQDDDISEEEFNEDDFEEFAEEDEADEFGDEISDEEDVMAKLKALKQKKSTNSLDVRIVKQDDLSDLDDDELSFAENDDEDISIDEDDFDEDDFEDEEEELEEEEDPLAKLKALKELKKAGKAQKEDALSNLKSTKEAKKAAKDKDQKHSSKKETRVLSLQEQEMLRRDEEDIAYYAKKLGLKNGAKSKLTKEDDNDIIGGLLDGLEFDLYDDYSEPGSESNDEEADPIKELKSIKEAKKAKKEPKVSNSHEELLRRDEEDIAYYAKKLGLKNGSKSKLTKIDDDDEIGGLLDGLDLDFGDEVSEEEEQSEDDEEDEDLGSESEDEVKEKENPFVAPVEKSEGESKYIPPALRRKLALENSSVSEEVLRLRKEIKGALNKLSESNISTIVNSINELYLNNPRQMINEELTTIVLDSVIQQGRLLDTFVYLHASLVVAIHRLQGVEFGAYFIQTLIEKFEGAYKDTSKSKESSNMVSLISSVYLFQLISSKLIYDIIKNLIKDLNENNADLLLRLIRSSGNQMRSDDPNSLKEIIIEMNKSVSNVLQDKLTTRTQFLIETISSLKNNKLKVSNEINHQLSIRLKKFLATINNNKLSDPIQVSLEDIHSVETRGKWWLVGSAWKGHSNDDSNSNVNELVMNDILDQADPNWIELARAQRMNTDIRRAIFVSIMSASDYIDAVTKLDKLALKRSQEREIPRVLLQCAGVEPAWNPYYGILAKKLCELHSYRKTFQFMLWDLIKDLEGSADDEDDFLGFDNSEDNEDDKLKRTLNLGRFYGFLISEGCLPLHILRTVNFLTANTNTVLFMEVLFVTILDKLGKKSQVRLVGLSSGSKEMKFEDKLLIEMILKAKEQQTLLRGIQYFLQEKVRTSDIIDGKKQRTRVEWGVNAFIDIIDELAKSDRD